MRWDIFCKVIDNHGDAGVCWRLARELAGEGEQVRLWIDDPSALSWMAPVGAPGVDVIHWRDAHDIDAARLAPAQAPDVLIEAFGCEPAEAVIAQLARAISEDGVPRHWINLEYLSAEPYVERLHGLPSPVFRGAGAGLTKRFFYPGFTPATGGLLREHGLMAERDAFDRPAWLAAQAIPWGGERLVSLFCYEPPGLPALLDAWRRGPEPTLLVVTAGRSSAAVRSLLSESEVGAGATGALRLHWLPHVPQPDFDRLLWSCDLNFVRGEDSLVRGLWAGAPLVWQIYPQDDDAHHVKLGAFLEWMDSPASLVRFHHAWNGFSDATPHLPTPEELVQWGAVAAGARTKLLAQESLAQRLYRFVGRKS
ncbi:elongation factor P maturation arginine rhamnosyltransferase EarP [Variovorax dokdonensis]|uniref:Protein-arginine rhamnosyltransferase n=1 Tax=Variovorax dokdonensis TaxID=344883 RepID=A0ABT7NEI6_9BURK|nr:elongation factor P maturation arginine rhamnosyltransferase EarP [Variovorax dokdonensis]MDM0046364.1 elongation factor P maturation arginine rhamnosyltransferase EarP [Variovorax dokdonensis]